MTFKLTSRDSQGFRMILGLARMSPWRTLLIVALLLLAGLAEGIGVATVLPLLGAAGFDGGATGTSSETANMDEMSELEQLLNATFDWLGYVPNFVEILLLIAVVFWIKAGLVLLAATQAAYASTDFATWLRTSLLRALMFARWSYFTGQSVGSLANAISQQAGTAGGACASVFNAMAFGTQLIFYLAIALLMSWQMTIAAIFVGAFIFATLHVFIRMSRRASQDINRSYESILTQLVDKLVGIKTIKAMASEDQVGPMLEAEANRLNHANRRQLFSKTAQQKLSEPILISALCVGLGVIVALTTIEIATLLMLALVFYRSVTQLAQLQRFYQQIVSSEPFVHGMVVQIEEAERQREPKSGMRVPQFLNAVELKAIEFAYGDHKVLKRVDLQVPAHGMTAIIGPSGSGKTTLADLVIGLYQPDSGQISIDGVALTEIDIVAWRRMIGYVPQELTLFNDSILENVTLNDPVYDRQAAEEALQLAGAGSFVAHLSHGIDTMVGERGLQLSGGQRQRISLARALIRQPKFLILDEPTTALDPDTEAEICDTLSRLADRVGILAISHQKAVMDAADVVYRMVDGQLIEDGPAAVRTDINKVSPA